MASPSTPVMTTQGPQADSTLTLRRWIAMLLRLSIGLGLLNSGLTGYMSKGANGFQNMTGSGLEPLMAALPYFSIALGLALILGFLTKVTSIASGFFTLVSPLLVTVQIMTAAMTGMGQFQNQGWGNNNPFMAMLVMNAAPSLIAQSLLIWLAPLENHPISIDTLIFGRRSANIPQVAPAESKVEPFIG